MKEAGLDMSPEDSKEKNWFICSKEKRKKKGKNWTLTYNIEGKHHYK